MLWLSEKVALFKTKRRRRVSMLQDEMGGDTSEVIGSLSPFLYF